MKCPNCGQEFEGERCPNCGRPSIQPARRIAAIVVLIAVVLPSALAGSCSIAICGSTLANPHEIADGTWIEALLILAVAVAVLIGSVRIVKRLWRG